MQYFQSINPFTQETLQKFPIEETKQVNQKINQAWEAYQQNKAQALTHRCKAVEKLGSLLRAQTEDLAPLLTREMGKPLAEAESELEKCAWLCDYYAEQADAFLAPRSENTDALKSYVRYDPLGVVLAVMPWNFPFWQVFRCAVPAYLAGNTVLLKHAENVQGCAQALEQLFSQAGLGNHALQNICIAVEQIEEVVAHPKVRAVSLTGSLRAGRSLAAVAGKHLKPQVLELGGSNAFVIFEDAPLEKAAELALNARMMNNAQSCIAAKRFLVHEAVADAFTELLKKKIAGLKMGNPMDREIDLGPLARVDLAEQLADQVERATQAGAQLLIGGKRHDAFYEPTLLTQVGPENPAFQEELFGPVFSLTMFKTAQEAVDLVNQSDYGLGVSLITKNLERAKGLIPAFEDGAVFINDLVKSHPHLPFGGTKHSGYGRELSREGIRAFTNVKTVAVKNSLS